MSLKWQQYRKNEACNLHSENLVLIATAVGDEHDQQRAAEILEKHIRDGEITFDNYFDRNTLNHKLFPLFQLQYAPRKNDGHKENQTHVDPRPDDPHLPKFHKALHAGYKGTFYEWHKEHFGTFWCPGVAT